MADRPNAKIAADTWRLIRALGDPEVGTAMVLKRDDDFHAAAQNLIEMACDAVETCTATQQLLALEKALQRDGFEKVPRVLVLEIAGHLSMLAQGHVPPNLKEQAADLLVKVGNILSE